MQVLREYNAIRRYIDSLVAFSDHEHHLEDSFFSEAVTLEKLLNNSYVSWTHFSSDGTQQSRRALLDNVRFNSYFTWFTKGLQHVHGIDHPIDLDNWDTVSALISRRYAADPDFHWKALLDAGYEKLIQDSYWNPGDDGGHPQVFAAALRIDKFMYGFHGESIAPNDFHVWKRYGFDGGSLEDYVDNMRQIIISRFRSGQIVALKCAEAYNRPIDFQPDDKNTAEQAFGTAPDKIQWHQFIAFGNYIFNRCCELAGELDIPLQVHTGLGQLPGSQPMNLVSTIARHPKTRFILFHAGYPWTDQVAGIIHNYPNALPSLTWLPIISTAAAIRTLHEFIEVGSSINRITWGSDCWVPEESVGAMLAWRFVVGKVLAERLVDGLICASDAEAIARKLMYENGRTVYLSAPKGGS